MDDFPHLATGSVTDEDLNAVKSAFSHLVEKEKSIETEPSEVTISKDPAPESSAAQNKEEPEEFFNNEAQKITKLFETLKKKSGDVADICKEDINEIYTTIKDDANSTLSTLTQGFNAFSTTISDKYQSSRNTESDPSTSQREVETGPITSLFSKFSLFSSKTNVEEAANKFSSGISSFFKNAIVIEAPVEVVVQERKKMFDKKFAKLVSLQNNVATYTTNPAEVEKEADLFKDYTLDMDEDDFPERAFKLLEENPEMKSIFNRLVPNVLSQKTFWTRYYFRAYLLEKEETEKKTLINNALVQDEELFSWDDDEDSEPEKDTKQEEPIPSTEQLPPKEDSPKEEGPTAPKETPITEESKSGVETSMPPAVDEETKSDKEDDDWGQWE